MNCPTCGKENPDDAKSCASCGAIVREAKRPRIPRGVSCLLLAVLGLAICLGMVFTVLITARMSARRMHCPSNLKEVAFALKAYAGEHGQRYPCGSTVEAATHWRHLGRLHPTYASSVGIFFCPSSSDSEWSPTAAGKRDNAPIPEGHTISFSYSMDGSEPTLQALRESMPSTVKVVADKPCALDAKRHGRWRGNHGTQGRTVAFLDGSGRWISGPFPLDVDDDDPRDQTGPRWWSDPPILE